MSQATVDQFRAILNEGVNCNGLLNINKLRISIYERKLELAKANTSDCEELQMLDIIERIINYCLKQNMAGYSTYNDSEATYKLASLLDLLLRDTSLKLIIGEQISRATKRYQEKNLKHNVNNGQSKAFGHRVDILMETMGVELSACELKKDKVSKTTAIQQYISDMLVNKAILAEILNLSLSSDDQPTVMSMDWIDPVGYMFLVRKVHDVFVIDYLDSLKIPSTLIELKTFMPTLDWLFKWKQHHMQLQQIVESAKIQQQDQEKLQSVMPISLSKKVRLQDSDDAYIPWKNFEVASLIIISFLVTFHVILQPRMLYFFVSIKF
jgi:hypothetical protein